MAVNNNGGMQTIGEFTVKTLYQKINQIISTPKPVMFAQAITLGKEYETIQGGYVEFGDIFPTPQANFNEGAFVPTALNFDSTATGVLSNNRNDVHQNGQQKYRFVMPDSKDDSNYYQFIVNYKKSAYKNQLLDENFISASLASLEEAAQLLLANRIINGFTAVGPQGSAIQYDGLKQLVEACKEDVSLGLTDVPSDLAGYSAKYIDLSYAVNNLDTLAKVNTILDKMANTNSCFCYGTEQDASGVKYISNGSTPMIICGNKMRRAIEMQNYQFYKNINEAIMGTSAPSVGGAEPSQTGFQGLVTIPETTLDVRFSNGNKVSTLINITNNPLSDGKEIVIDLEDDEILLINPQSGVLGQFDDMLMDVDNTSNNVTTTHTLILHGNCQAYLPIGTLCIVKCPKLLNVED